MVKRALKTRYTGEKLTVAHCKGAIDSFNKAIKCLKAQKQESFVRSMDVQLNRLANKGRLSGENFPKEGKLPNGKKFNALKFIPIRGYCWSSDRHRSHYIVSHYIEKDFGKLKKADIDKVGRNWNRIEVDNEEI